MTQNVLNTQKPSIEKTSRRILTMDGRYMVLANSLRAQGKTEEASAVTEQFETAWKHSDVQLSSSCFCLPGPE